MSSVLDVFRNSPCIGAGLGTSALFIPQNSIVSIISFLDAFDPWNVSHACGSSENLWDTMMFTKGLYYSLHFSMSLRMEISWLLIASFLWDEMRSPTLLEIAYSILPIISSIFPATPQVALTPLFRVFPFSCRKYPRMRCGCGCRRGGIRNIRIENFGYRLYVIPSQC